MSRNVQHFLFKCFTKDKKYQSGKFGKGQDFALKQNTKVAKIGKLETKIATKLIWTKVLQFCTK